MNVISLGDWLKACASRNLPHVPASLVGEVSQDAVFQALDGIDSEEIRTLFASLQTVQKAPGPEKRMLRWDCCAPGSLKSALARGRPQWNPEFHQIFLDDPRFLSLLFEFPDPRIRLWSRPWVEAEQVASYPVEFRVFVQDHRIRGVSSYYPQRPLPESPYRDIAQECAIRTEALLGAAPSFTADWIRTTTGELLFLEGGPPHQPGAGAHPCCFPTGEIEGIALAPLSSSRTSGTRSPEAPPREKQSGLDPHDFGL